MAHTGVNWVDLFKRQVKRDYQALVDEVFSNVLTVGGEAAPACVSDTAWLRFRMRHTDPLDPELESILKQELSRQLDIHQSFCRIWLSEDLDTEALYTLWQAQTEATERWNVFMAQLIEQFPDAETVSKAFRFAFEIYPYQDLIFETEAERQLWIAQLKSQLPGRQQERERLISKLADASRPPALHELKAQTLRFNETEIRLEPGLFSILEVLWDGEAHTAVEIIRLAWGRRIVAQSIQDNLSKRISDLNARLIGIWGPRNNKKRWIESCLQAGSLAYRLYKP